MPIVLCCHSVTHLQNCNFCQISISNSTQCIHKFVLHCLLAMILSLVSDKWVWDFWALWEVSKCVSAKCVGLSSYLVHAVAAYLKIRADCVCEIYSRFANKSVWQAQANFNCHKLICFFSLQELGKIICSSQQVQSASSSVFHENTFLLICKRMLPYTICQLLFFLYVANIVFWYLSILLFTRKF